MAKALSSIIEIRPPLVPGEALWDAAILQASRSHGPRRKSDAASSGERMRRFREMIEQELVSFHDALIVSPHKGKLKPRQGTELWDIGIPLTLFPKRDRGFTRVECLIEFCNEKEGNAGIRIVRIFPQERDEVMAQAEMGAHLELKTKAKLGLPSPFDPGSSVADVSSMLYGKLETAHLTYKAIRKCVETEIIRGSQARWRLEDAREPERIAAESHQLAVVLEIEHGSGPVEAAGYLQAYSDTRWLTSSMGSLWRDFAGKLKSLFQRGVPAEGYGEWENIITP